MTTVIVNGKTFEAVSWMKYWDVFAFTTEGKRTFTVRIVSYKKQDNTITLSGWLENYGRP